MLNQVKPQGRKGLFPWGISHKVYLTPAGSKIGNREGFIVETHYHLRMKLPKYVKKLYGVDFTAKQMEAIFQEFANVFNNIVGNVTYRAVEVAFHDTDIPEISCKMVVLDEPYAKYRVAGFCLRVREILNEVLDIFRAKIKEKCETLGVYTYLNYRCTENGCIRYIRSP